MRKGKPLARLGGVSFSSGAAQHPFDEMSYTRTKEKENRALVGIRKKYRCPHVQTNGCREITNIHTRGRFPGLLLAKCKLICDQSAYAVLLHVLNVYVFSQQLTFL
jgi:hypothetical protein